MTARPQPVQAAPGQKYGMRKMQEDAQKVVPMAGPPAAMSGATPPPQGPVQRPNVFGPTERPSEPITAGAALGAGPSNLGLLPDTSATDLLTAIVMNGLDPSGAVRRLLERMAR